MILNNKSKPLISQTMQILCRGMQPNSQQLLKLWGPIGSQKGFHMGSWGPGGPMGARCFGSAALGSAPLNSESPKLMGSTRGSAHLQTALLGTIHGLQCKEITINGVILICISITRISNPLGYMNLQLRYLMLLHIYMQKLPCIRKKKEGSN